MAAKMIRVKVKPGSRVSALEEQPDGTWLARVKAPPVDGKANAELGRAAETRTNIGVGDSHRCEFDCSREESRGP